MGLLQLGGIPLSKEVRAGWGCSHLVMEEPVTLGSDRRSLRTRGPIAGAGTVRILVNDSQYVPASGLDSQAVLTAASAAPYQVKRCTGLIGPDGDLFTVTTGAGSVSVRIPTGDAVPLARVQRTLRLSGINDLVSVTDQNGALSLVESQKAGPTSFIRVSGEAVPSLGFIQTGARGLNVYPGWDLIARQDIFPAARRSGVTLVPARYPVFKSPLTTNPTIKVTYTSMPERCPRCGATYVENDYRFDAKGDIVTIENEDLLQQACLKALLTVQGSNAFHTLYGSLITTRIGAKSVGAVATLIKGDVAQALQQVQNLQSVQKTYQPISSKEVLRSVESINVSGAADDPTKFFVDVVVRNGSNQPINLSTVFTVPGTVALAGTNNQALGGEAVGLSSRRTLLDG